MDNTAEREKVFELARTFLLERRVSHGGWAQVTSADEQDLHDIVEALILAKCEQDPDGDRPIEFAIYNATRERDLSCSPIPYSHKIVSEEDLERVMQLLAYNYSVAQGQFQTFLSRRHDLIERIRSKQEEDVWCIQGRSTLDPHPSLCDGREVLTLIDQFLAEPRESHGGWAEINDADIELLEKVIHALIRAKCQQDPDGDYPFTFQVVDRTKFERMSFRPVEIDTKGSSEQDLENILDTCWFNLGLAHNALDTFMRVRRFELKRITKPA